MVLMDHSCLTSHPSRDTWVICSLRLWQIVAGWITASKESEFSFLDPVTVILSGKGGSADVLKFSILWWRGAPGLSRWAWSHHSVLPHKDAERDVTLEAGEKVQGDVRKGLWAQKCTWLPVEKARKQMPPEGLHRNQPCQGLCSPIRLISDFWPQEL